MAAETGPVRIAILLSTHNGSRYVGELLESIVEQSWLHWDLWIRDDGSNDGTLRILRDFAGRFGDSGLDGTASRVHLFPEENIGVAGSFFRLLEVAGSGYAGYAFCDQDDVWLPEKLERAVMTLEQDVPFLYHCRQWLTDQDGGKRVLSPVPVRTGFANALVQNQVVGCTMVINARLRKCVLHSLREVDGVSPVSGIIMHDWWCYLLASGTGCIHYDPEPQILFRRHGKNTTPAAEDPVLALRGRLSGFGNRNWSLSHIMVQAEHLWRYFSFSGDATVNWADSDRKSTTVGEDDDSDAGLDSAPKKQSSRERPCKLPEANRHLLESLVALRKAGFLKRVGYLFGGVHRRSGMAETIVFRLLVLLQRF